MTQLRCGFVAIVGRPNVGKSTLLNALMAEKVSITSDKPQTTRYALQGIKTKGDTQVVFIDTPGLHQRHKKHLNKAMNKEARHALMDVDLVIFVVEAQKWTPEDDHVLALLQYVQCPVYLVINKIDIYKDKTKLLPIIQKLSSKMNFAQVFPISAAKEVQLAVLEASIFSEMPENEHFFSEQIKTDKPEFFHYAEIIREKLMRRLGQEIPYALAVEIEKVEQQTNAEQKKKTTIYSVIWVERATQKHIVIGKKGEKLKQIGIDARRDLESRLGHQVRLTLWVKVRDNWSDDQKALASLGFIDLNE